MWAERLEQVRNQTCLKKRPSHSWAVSDVIGLRTTILSYIAPVSDAIGFGRLKRVASWASLEGLNKKTEFFFSFLFFKICF